MIIKRKINLICTLLFAMLFSSSAFSADNPSMTMKITATIKDATCSFKEELGTIPLGEVDIADLSTTDISLSKAVKVELKCGNDAKSVYLTMNGTADTGNTFKNEGNATGVGLRIFEDAAKTKVVTPNTTKVSLTPGSGAASHEFTLGILALSGATPGPGSFLSTVTIAISYT
jgi:type 1 fimbria pilin